ncbi:Protein-lysine N-methyltransferase efm4 [Teratosphaeriaceae sp. CCFEE 6253]|nr:Protein-lysine N-methyltransferase efm4 [Teratosphaeriaceae sp. CCFEE 6253]
MSLTSPPEAANRRLLDPSELGTKEYWEAAYARELGNYEEDADDEGTVWFSESNAEEAVLEQLNKLAETGLLRRDDDNEARQTSRFLDLGTGNGHLLFALREEDDEGRCWTGDMVGVDYSETSVRLARRIAVEKDVEGVQFETWDLLNHNPDRAWLQGGFDVVLDKGTFDAISLMPFAEGSQNPCKVYREKVEPLIKPRCFLCITSCNWTKDELLEWLAPNHGCLRYHSEAKYPTFTFGGRTGQSIVTLSLQRVADTIE